MTEHSISKLLKSHVGTDGLPMPADLSAEALHEMAKQASRDGFVKLFDDAVGRVDNPMTNQEFMERLVSHTALTWSVYSANSQSYDMGYVTEKLFQTFEALRKIKEAGQENATYNYSDVRRFSEVYSSTVRHKIRDW